MVGLSFVVVFSMQCQRDSQVTMFAGPGVSPKAGTVSNPQPSRVAVRSSTGAMPTMKAQTIEQPIETESRKPVASKKPLASSSTELQVADMAPGGAVASTASVQAQPIRLPESDRLAESDKIEAFGTNQAYDENEEFARRDPMGFLNHCWDQYKSNVSDYRCTFTKHERINGEYKPEQIADVRFSEKPFSVDMTFTKNIGECARALYVADKWLDDEGNQQAWAKPGGAIVRLLISKILQPIHGARAQKASRRTIDQFGFGKSFELILYYSVKAQKEDALTLRYVGEGSIDGRPTYQFERVLPFDGDESNYPDHLLEFHVDKEWLLPVACIAYSDQAGKDLLGSYIYTDVVLNPGYTPEDFDPDVINF